jgi:hypothetical protein
MAHPAMLNTKIISITVSWYNRVFMGIPPSFCYLPGLIDDYFDNVMLLHLLGRDGQIPAFLYGVMRATGICQSPFERTWHGRTAYRLADGRWDNVIGTQGNRKACFAPCSAVESGQMLK